MQTYHQDALATAVDRHPYRTARLCAVVFAAAVLGACSSQSWRSSSALWSDGKAPRAADTDTEINSGARYAGQAAAIAPSAQTAAGDAGSSGGADTAQSQSTAARAPEADTAASGQIATEESGTAGTDAAGGTTSAGAVDEGWPVTDAGEGGQDLQAAQQRDTIDTGIGSASGAGTGEDAMSASGAQTDSSSNAVSDADRDAAQEGLADAAAGREGLSDAAGGQTGMTDPAAGQTGMTDSGAERDSMSDAAAGREASTDAAGKDGAASAWSDATAERDLTAAAGEQDGAGTAVDPAAERDLSTAAGELDSSLAGEAGQDADDLASSAKAGASTQSAPGADGSAAAQAPGAQAQQEEVIVGMVETPGKKATPTETVIPQTLGGILPLTLGVEGEGEFDFDRAILREQVKSVLDEVAARLKTAEYDRLEIVGHADRVGTEIYNQYLSERRAWAVARYLVQQGVPATKLVVEGRGMHEPLTSADDCAGLGREQTIACLQRDRRVVISASIRRVDVNVH